MVDRDTLDRRLARLEELVARLRGIAARGRDAFLADVGLQAQRSTWKGAVAPPPIPPSLRSISR